MDFRNAKAMEKTKKHFDKIQGIIFNMKEHFIQDKN